MERVDFVIRSRRIRGQRLLQGGDLIALAMIDGMNISTSKSSNYLNARPSVPLGIRGTSVLVASCSTTTISSTPLRIGMLFHRSR